MENQLVELLELPRGNALLTFFTTDAEIDPILAKIRTRIDEFTPDLSSKKGREEIKSFAYDIARSKTYIDDAGKKLVADMKELPKKIDANRKRLRETLDQWRDEVRQPLTDWETAEEARIKKHADAIESINKFGSPGAQDTATMLEGALLIVTEVEIGPECEEFIDEYRMAKDRALASLRAALIAREQFEADQAELAKLRAEAAERAEKERAEQLARDAKEAAERQERETAAKIAAEAEKAVQAERDRAARALAQAEAKALAESQAAERRERELKEAAETARREAAETEARIAREAAAAKAAEEAETAKREADKAHKAKIDREAVKAFVAGGISEEIAKAVVVLIAKKAIPAIQISY